MNSIRKALGLSLFLLSGLAWLMLPALPFWPDSLYPLSTEQRVGAAGALLVFGEITWWLAVVLLGKELVEACRYYWKKVKARVGLASND